MTAYKESAVKLIKSALLVVGMLAHATAQDIRGDYTVDCKLFQKKSDGTWFLFKQTIVQAGSTRVTLAPGSIGRGDVLIGSADLHSILLNVCDATRN
jgi:hypothetical protein